MGRSDCQSPVKNAYPFTAGSTTDFPPQIGSVYALQIYKGKEKTSTHIENGKTKYRVEIPSHHWMRGEASRHAPPGTGSRTLQARCLRNPGMAASAGLSSCAHLLVSPGHASRNVVVLISCWGIWYQARREWAGQPPARRVQSVACCTCDGLQEAGDSTAIKHTSRGGTWPSFCLATHLERQVGSGPPHLPL